MSLTRGPSFLFLQLHSASRRLSVQYPRANSASTAYVPDASRHEYESLPAPSPTTIFHSNRRTEKYWWLERFYRVICQTTMPDLLPPCQRDQRERAISPIDPRLFRPFNLPPYSCSKPRCEKRDTTRPLWTDACRVLDFCDLDAISHPTRYSAGSGGYRNLLSKGTGPFVRFRNTRASLCFEIYARSSFSSPRKSCRFDDRGSNYQDFFRFLSFQTKPPGQMIHERMKLS